MKITEVTLNNGLVLRIGSHISFKIKDWYLGQQSSDLISDAYVDAFEIAGDEILIHANFYIREEEIFEIIKDD